MHAPVGEYVIVIAVACIMLLFLFGGLVALLALLGSRTRLLILLLVGVPCLAILTVASLLFLSWGKTSAVYGHPAIIQGRDTQKVPRNDATTPAPHALQHEPTMVRTSIVPSHQSGSATVDPSSEHGKEPGSESVPPKTETLVTNRDQAELGDGVILPDETVVESIDEAPRFDAPIPIGVKTAIVSSSWWVTRSECEKELPKEVQRVVSAFNRQILQSMGGSVEELVRAPKYNWRNSSTRHVQVYFGDETLGAMRRINLRLEFDKHYLHELEDCWKDTLTARRMTYAAVPALGMFLVLGTVFSYMKLDLETQGAYAFRLRLAAFAAILVIVGCGATAIRYLPWL